MRGRRRPFAFRLSEQLGLGLDDFDAGLGLHFSNVSFVFVRRWQSRALMLGSPSSQMCEAIATDIALADNGVNISRWVPGSAAMRSLGELAGSALLEVPAFSAGFVRPLSCFGYSRATLTLDAIHAGISASARIALAVTSSPQWEGISASGRSAAVARQRQLAHLRFEQSSATDELLPDPQ